MPLSFGQQSLTDQELDGSQSLRMRLASSALGMHQHDEAKAPIQLVEQESRHVNKSFESQTTFGTSYGGFE